MTGDRETPPDGWGLVLPFTVVASAGGPYDDEAFAAGWQGGRLDATLQLASALGANNLTATVYTTLLPQADLVGMRHGYTMHATPIPDTDTAPDRYTWAHVTFRTDEGV